MRKLMIVAALVPFAAAGAESITDTHEEVWQPIGKTVKLYRPKDRVACGPAHVHHQAGKSQHMPVPAQKGCGPAELARTDVDTRRN